jgi:hypothetical protein
MNPFLEHLPWRVASLAGLMVGAISLATGADVWTGLLRVGAAFFFFGVLGVGLRAVLRQGVSSPPPPADHRAADLRAADHRGRRFDQTTPPDEAGQNASASSDANDVK